MFRLFVLSLLVLSSSCALRSRYSDFINPKTTGPEVLFQLTDTDGKPLPNVRIEVSELKNRLTVTTRADGTFTLPVEKKYLSEDPIIVVSVPPGVAGYKLSVVVPEPQPAAPQAEPATPEKS